MSQPRIFVSYSRHDKRHLDQLLTHLAPLQREGKVDVWADTRLRAGDNWREEIRQALASAKVAIVLVSAKFRASKFIDDEGLPPLLSAAKQQGVVIIPVIVGRCDFQDSELAYVQAANEPSRPLSALNRDKRGDVWVNVVRRVRKALRDDDGQAPVAAATAPSEPSLPQPAEGADDLVKRGKVLSAQKQFAESIAAVDRALGVRPNDARLWATKADALFRLDRFGEALEAAERCINLDPDSGYGWGIMAGALDRLNRYHDALYAAERCIRLQPDNSGAWTAKGDALIGFEGDYQGALKAFERAVELDPDDSLARFNMGYALEELGRYDEALTAYDQAFDRDSPTDWQAHARVYRALGRETEAQEAERRAKELGG